jgi:hypothetical protein
MWVSLLPLEAFPGFGRMMDFFGPPMELFSGMSAVFAEHFKVKKFHWDQSKDNIGVCLDGDPTDAGTSITVEHLPQAWRIMAPTEYPRKVPDEMIKVGKLTKPAAAWLATNPPPPGTFMPAPGTKPPKAKKEKKSKKSKEGSSTV